MFARLTQLTRHLSRPSLSSSFLSASSSPLQRNPATMTSSATANATKTIHTAACLIIGDEVLGGKVSFSLGELKEVVWVLELKGREYKTYAVVL